MDSQNEDRSYQNTGWYSWFSFSWVNPLVEKGCVKQVNLDDTSPLGFHEDALVNTHRLLNELEYAEHERHRHPLLRAVVKAFKWEIAFLQCGRIITHLLTLLSPLLMKQVIIFQEDQNKGNGPKTDSELMQSQGLAAMVGLITLGIFMIFWNSQLDYYQARVDVRISSALRGVVLMRCVQNGQATSSASTDGGESVASSQPAVYNVISFDVGPNIDIIWIVLGLWLFPFQFYTTLYVLFGQVQWAVVPGVIVILVAKTVNFVLLYKDGIYRDQLLSAKDVRLGLCNQGFNNIRTLQMLEWVPPFQQQIMVARREELRLRGLRLWMTKMCAALDYTLTAMVTLATLAYYVKEQGGELKASIAVPVIALIMALAGPFGQFPVWTQQYLVWTSAYKRVNELMGLSVEPKPDDPRTQGHLFPSSDSKVHFNKCQFSWVGSGESHETRGLDNEETETTQPLVGTQPVFMLKDIDMNVRCGELLVLVSKAGHGKSSVLQAMLGEMLLEGGTAYSPALLRLSQESEAGAGMRILPPKIYDARSVLAHSTESNLDPLAAPFASQTATLFTGTIRSNILFGAPCNDNLYNKVLEACALKTDVSTMPYGDETEVAEGGATLSGGQKARIGIARAAYRAVLMVHSNPNEAPLVLLDDPLCALDRKVATEVVQALFVAPTGLLASCALVVATADPWWLKILSNRDGSRGALRVAVVQEGSVVASGHISQLMDLGLSELSSVVLDEPEQESHAEDGTSGYLRSPFGRAETNPQDDAIEENAQDGMSYSNLDIDRAPAKTVFGKGAGKVEKTDVHSQTMPLKEDMEDAALIKAEKRESGHVKGSTYSYYVEAVGLRLLIVLCVALTGIMVFQDICDIWLAYWTEDDKEKSFLYKFFGHFWAEPPTLPSTLLHMYAVWVLCFGISNFAGHILEIVGGVRASRTIFAESLAGVLSRPFRWWDANPTGRVLNRFSSDVEVMDNAITNIMGVIFGAVLYFLGRTFFLLIGNPVSLLLLPLIALGLEYYASYYRNTIRELQRICLVSMGGVYQGMFEAIIGRVSVRAFAATRSVLCHNMASLDDYQRAQFAKTSVQTWLGLRMSLISQSISIFNTLYPLLQYYGIMKPQSAALIAFTIMYSSETVAVIRQFILNFSDLEMQLISVERLREYAKDREEIPFTWPSTIRPAVRDGSALQLIDVTVTYRPGIPPALSGINLSFAPSEVCAVVGRTGAGKSSLLLSILQLVPYDGRILVNGELLSQIPAEDVRQKKVGIVPQSPSIFAGSVRWNLDPKKQKTDAELFDTLKAVGLLGHVRNHPSGLDAIVADGCGEQATPAQKITLSNGQQQLLCAARVLLRQPSVVLLDEVTAFLPSEIAVSTLQTMINRFKQQRTTVLLVTHQTQLISCCERSITIAAGRVVQD